MPAANQLIAPLVNELASDNTAELHFIHGPVQAYPPEGFEEYFGQAPYYRFIEPNKGDGNGEGDDVLERIRHFPEGATAEDQMRELMSYGAGSVGSTPDSSDDGSNYGDYSNSSAQNAMDYLYQIMEKDGPFDGIVGYSEGATVAATLLLHEQRRFEREGRIPMFKCALFFAGWPPMTPEFDGIVLADETDLTITIPTCHISQSLPLPPVSSSDTNITLSRLSRSLLGGLTRTLQHLRHGHSNPLRSC